MVLIVKKLVPVYSNSAGVTRKYKNLKKNRYVTTFKYPYPNIPEILVKEYGLKRDEKIIVFWVREISLPHFNRYRTPFKKVFSGTVSEFGQYIKQFLKRKK